jgi:hypothetical protein
MVPGPGFTVQPTVENLPQAAFSSPKQIRRLPGPNTALATGEYRCAKVVRRWQHVSLNKFMNTGSPWPINRSGTSWRTITIWFGWSGKQIIWEAIETIDPLKVTGRLRPTVIVGFEGDGSLPVHDFVEIVRTGGDACIVVDPRPDLDRTLARIKEDFGDEPWISVLGIARLDVADRVVYEAFLAGLEDRR